MRKGCCFGQSYTISCADQPALRRFINDDNHVLNKKSVMAAHNRPAVLGQDDLGSIGERAALAPGGAFFATN
jgi:hypothetical protein